MQWSKPVKNKKKPVIFKLFIHISGRIWTVVSRGYFLHANSYRENVASASRVWSDLTIKKNDLAVAMDNFTIYTY